jgi:AcrR family transcriptional regulator
MTETMDAPVGGRRERKKLETRRRIRRAALDLALLRGVERLTVEEVTERADVSLRTFFNYFACKEDALIPETSDAAVELAAAVRARPPDEPPMRALAEAIGGSEMLRAARDGRERLLSRQQLVRDYPSLLPRQLAQYAALERSLAEAVADRLQVSPEYDLRPALLAAIAGSAIRVAMHRWAVDPTRPPHTLVAEAFAYCAEGLP